MSYKSILVVLDATSASEVCCSLAIDLARAFSAQLKALALAVEPAVPAIGMHPFLLDAIDIQRQTSAESAHKLLDEFRRAVHAAGLSPPLMAVEGHSEACTLHLCPDIIARYALSCDLLVMAQGDEAFSGPGSRELVERVALQIARPLLMVPKDFAQRPIGRRIALAWNASREAARAVHEALPFLLSARSVEILSVDELQDRRSVLNIARHLEQHGCKVVIGKAARPQESEGLSTGQLLLAAADEIGADLLVMGAYGHSRWRKIVLGSVTQTVFKEAKIPLLLSH